MSSYNGYIRLIETEIVSDSISGEQIFELDDNAKTCGGSANDL